MGKYCLLKLRLSANTCDHLHANVEMEIVWVLHSISKRATKNNCSEFWQNLLTARAHSCCALFDLFSSAERAVMRAQIMEFRGQLLWRRNYKYRTDGNRVGEKLRKIDTNKCRQTITHTDHDFVLSGEVGWLTQQLALRHSDRAGTLSNQYRVVKPHSSWRWGNQVSALWACGGGQRGVKLGEKVKTHKHMAHWTSDNFKNPQSQYVT